MRVVANQIVSIVVPTKNSARTLAACLASITKQTYPHIELLVVDNHSTDDTQAIAAQYGARLLVQGPERCAQRNAGFAAAKGEFLMYIDSDMTLTHQVVEQCVAKIADSSVDAITIHEISVGTGFWTQCKVMERSAYIGDSQIEGVRFFPRTVIDTAGGFDESLVSAEDWDLVERIRAAGFGIATIEARIYHDEGHIRILDLWKKKFYYGRHLSAFVARTPQVKCFDKKDQGIGYLLERIYFLRPSLWRNWRAYLRAPHHAIGMWIMLTGEIVFGGVGFIKGYLIRKRV